MDIPVFAICRGMQLLNVHLHGTLDQHLPAVSLHRQVFPEDPPGQQRGVHNVIVRPGTALAAIVGTGPIPVNSRHHQAVAELGAGLTLSGISDDGIPEAVEYPARRFVLGVQWHPEDRIEVSEADLALFKAFAAAVGS